MTAFLILSTLLGLSSLTGCSSVHVQEYAQQKPALSLENYFNGVIDIEGFFQDRSGRVTKRFSCVMDAKWSNGIGVLDETFTYSDGTTSKRIWTLKPSGDGKYIGTAADVVGEAKGEVAGNAFHMNYVLDLEVDGTHYHVSMDDWMFLMNDKVLLNRTSMSKFGYHIGDLIITMTRR